jgi:hypothetical protein
LVEVQFDLIVGAGLAGGVDTDEREHEAFLAFRTPDLSTIVHVEEGLAILASVDGHRVKVLIIRQRVRMDIRSGGHAQSSGAAHAEHLVIARLQKDHRPTRLVERFIDNTRHLPIHIFRDIPFDSVFLTLFWNDEGLHCGIFDAMLHENLVETTAGGNGFVEQRGMTAEWNTTDLTAPAVVPLISSGTIGTYIFEDFDCAYCLTGYYVTEEVVNSSVQDLLASCRCRTTT